MKEMVEGTVLPDLQRRAGVSAVIRSRTLRTWGYSESGLGRAARRRCIADASTQLGNPTIGALLASGMEGLKIRITAKAGHRAEAADRAARRRGGRGQLAVLGRGRLQRPTTKPMEVVIGCVCCSWPAA